MTAVWLGQTALIILGLADPFHLPSMRRLELFNEVSLLAQTYFMIIFSDFVPSYEAKFLAGHFVVILVRFNVFVNLTYINKDKP
jgi:hypothetical protein